MYMPKFKTIYVYVQLYCTLMDLNFDLTSINKQNPHQNKADIDWQIISINAPISNILVLTTAI